MQQPPQNFVAAAVGCGRGTLGGISSKSITSKSSIWCTLVCAVMCDRYYNRVTAQPARTRIRARELSAVCPTNPSWNMPITQPVHRLVDHEQRLSFAVILGSFRGRGGAELDQHYVSLSYLHEPKGGILPADVDDPEGQVASAAGGADSELEVAGDVDALSPQARASARAKRFSDWVREQRLAVLRGIRVERPGNPPKGAGKVAAGEAGVGVEDGDHGEGERKVEAQPGEHRGAGVDADGSGSDATGFSDRLGEAGPAVDYGQGAGTPGGEEGERERWKAGGERGQEGEDVDAAREPRPTAEAGSSVGELGLGIGVGEESSGSPEAVGDDGSETAADDSVAGPLEDEGGGASIPARDEPSGFIAQPLFPSSRSVEQSPHSPQPDLRPSSSPARAQEDPPERTHTFHAFPPPETVTISCRGEPVDSVPNFRDDPNFTWEADGIG